MKRTSASTVRDLLEHEIVTGGFTPGQRLDEAQLASRFGVSRTPIREALTQLAAIELVEVRPHRGTFVKVTSVPEMLAMFEVMGELEAVCARLAARRRTEAQLKELEQAYTACERSLHSGSADEYYYSNEEFHRLIYEASGNAYLTQMTTSMQLRLKPFRRLQLRVAGRMQSSLEEHEQILAALRTHDVEEVERLIKGHIAVQGDHFSDFLAAVSIEAS
ncbi:GntR family transcriptional regulator [Georgenia halophila]|uniref:GntR family transcriptional regulator n=1 Tax=Georgenia halophila TaxID=620889 RepID=A0ABP8LM53_9MICO